MATSVRACGQRDGGCYQFFQRGLMLWSPATGVHIVRGALLDRYLAFEKEAREAVFAAFETHFKADDAFQK